MIDARYLNGKTSGIGRYTYHLIKNLLEIDENLYLRLITHPNEPRPFDDARVDCQVFSHPPNSLSTRYRLSKEIDFRGVRLFHSPFNILPADLPVPSVFTLHDIMWLLDADYCTSKLWKKLVTGTFYKQFIPRSLHQAAGIFTVSHHSKNEIVDYFPEARGRVFVTYNGLDPFFRPLPAEEGWPLLRQWMAPKTPFVLIVGQGSPYKNHEGALRGFLNAFGDQPEVHCVLVRRLHSQASGELAQLIKDPRLNSRIHQLDYITGQELRALYSMAFSFLFPSLYEGFGLPALEAMACGTAVVASNMGAPAEVASTGAIQVDPLDENSIGKALRDLYFDKKYRDSMQNKALERANEFEWKVCAQRALRYYEEILGTWE